jgi:hypothetical protein
MREVRAIEGVALRLLDGIVKPGCPLKQVENEKTAQVKVRTQNCSQDYLPSATSMT